MERAGRLLGKSKSALSCLSPEELAKAAWRAAVGKRIASRAVAVSLVRSRLVIEVEDEIWRKNLWTLRGQILRKLDEVFGSGVVTELEFRLGLTRRMPQREERPVRDEADHIEDPVLRSLYRTARRRATA